MLADRTIEFHSQFGRHHTSRIPHFGRTIAYQRETCDLLAAGASEDVYRLNLEQGCFLTPLRTVRHPVSCHVSCRQDCLFYTAIPPPARTALP